MRRSLSSLAAALLVVACANPADLVPDSPDTGVAPDTGVDALAPKDAGKDSSSKPSDSGADSSVSDAGSDATVADATVDAALDAAMDASDGGSVIDASDGGGSVDGGATNDTCAQGVTLVDGVAVNGDTTSAADDYHVEVNISSVCSSNSSLGLYTYDGNDVAYTITVPDTKKLTVVVTPTSAWDPAVAIVSSCASVGPTCLGGADEGFSSDPETAVYTNTTGSPQTVFILVDSYSTSEMGPFTIKASLQ